MLDGVWAGTCIPKSYQHRLPRYTAGMTFATQLVPWLRVKGSARLLSQVQEREAGKKGRDVQSIQVPHYPGKK